MADRTHQQVEKFKTRRVRRRLVADPERPRLTVKKTNRYISTSVVDDVSGRTIVSATTQASDFDLPNKKDKQAARELGKRIAGRAIAKGVEKVRFDRSGYIYHGRVAELAAGAREGGLKF